MAALAFAAGCGRGEPDFRATAAAGWLAAGLPMIFIQRQLGHRDISTTIGLYRHLEESLMRDAAARAERAIWARFTPPPAASTPA